MNQEKTHNFTLVNLDTDSITICKPDGAEFTKEEKLSLLDELNSLFPEKVKWEDDGYYDTIIVFKAKNYALYDGKKIKIKGSGLKASTKCAKLKEFTSKAIDIIIYNKDINEAIRILQEEYMKLVVEILDIRDMKPWAARKTYSQNTDESDTTQAAKLRKVLRGTDYREGDRFYVFYTPDELLCLVENFKGIYDKKRLLKNLFDTMMIFETVIPDCDKLFLNYSLKKNEKFLPGYIPPEPKVKPRKKKEAEVTV